MPSLNKVTLMGHLGQDPELKYTPSGKAVARMSIATTDGSKEKPVTSWHSCIGWQKTAELWQKYLRKGQAVYIEGRINYEKWKDKETGVQKERAVIVCDKFIMLGGKPTGSTENSVTQTQQPATQQNLDNIPF